MTRALLLERYREQCEAFRRYREGVRLIGTPADQQLNDTELHALVAVFDIHLADQVMQTFRDYQRKRLGTYEGARDNALAVVQTMTRMLREAEQQLGLPPPGEGLALHLKLKEERNAAPK